MRYIEPVRAKFLMILFFATGSVGIVIGLSMAPPSVIMIITFMGVINIGLGAFFCIHNTDPGGKVTGQAKAQKKEIHGQ